MSKFTTAMFKLCQNLNEFRPIDNNILLALICKVVFFLQRRLGICNKFVAVNVNIVHKANLPVAVWLKLF